MTPKRHEEAAPVNAHSEISEMHLRRSKWVSTAASIWIQSVAGSPYCFGIYSSLLKSTQHYDQSTLETVAFFKDLGANAGVLAGLLHSASSHHRGGPWVVLAAGAAQCFLGYLLIWLPVSGRLPPPPVPLMCFYMLLAAHAQPFLNTANIVTAVHNFPDSRGTAVGIMKGFLGLSGAILVQLYRTKNSWKPESFILMLALLPSLLTLVLMYFVKVDRTDGGDDRKLLDGFSVIAVTTAGYLMVIIIWENIQTFGSAARILAFTILLLLLASPISIVIRGHLRDSRILSEFSCPERIRLIDSSGSSEATDEAIYHTTDGKPFMERNPISASVVGDLNLCQAMRTWDFWLLFLGTACGMGSGLATINNIGQIGSSLGYASTEISTLVSLLSIWNFTGRFGAGYISDYFLRSQGCARPLFMAITLLTMSAGHLLISSGLPGALYVGSVAVGVCYGSQWSLMPTIVSDIFGLTHLGTIFNSISIASPVGSYILSVRLVGYIYDFEASASGSKVCTGRHCFMISFMIMACVSFFGFIISLILFFRTKKFYEQVIFARLQQSVA